MFNTGFFYGKDRDARRVFFWVVFSEPNTSLKMQVDMKRQDHLPTAITRVELLVVIDTIGALLPVDRQDREAARRTRSANHLTQLSLPDVRDSSSSIRSDGWLGTESMLQSRLGQRFEQSGIRGQALDGTAPSCGLSGNR